MRLPTVFTALSNVLCGFFVSQKSDRLTEMAARAELWLLLLSSSGLYLGGMVLNDVFDASLDAEERPERPIPSGRVTRRAAAILGAGLLLLGVLCACLAGWQSDARTLPAQVASLLALAVLFYDAQLKSTLFGPIGMAFCRFLNVLLGASAVGTMSQLLQGPQLSIAGGLFVYVLGVTWFARYEAGQSSRAGLFSGLLVALGGIAFHGLVLLRNAAVFRPATGAMVALLLIAANIALRAVTAIRSGQSGLLQKTVGFMLLHIIFMDAALTFGWTGSGQLASVIAILVVPAMMLRRRIPMS